MRQHSEARSDWLESNMAKSTRPTFASFTGNGYDLAKRETATPEDDVPSYEQTRLDITAAFLRMAETGERPDPGQFARMEAGLREGVATGKGAQPKLPPEPVVYYFRVGNRIKIGRTGNLQGRIKDLAPEEVLGWETGDSETERMRHRQFASYRTNREWFEDCTAIREHIATLA